MDGKIGIEEINKKLDYERDRKGFKQLFKGQTQIEELGLKRQPIKQNLKGIEKDSNSYTKDRYGQKHWE